MPTTFSVDQAGGFGKKKIHERKQIKCEKAEICNGFWEDKVSGQQASLHGLTCLVIFAVCVQFLFASLLRHPIITRCCSILILPAFLSGRNDPLRLGSVFQLSLNYMKRIIQIQFEYI